MAHRRFVTDYVENKTLNVGFAVPASRSPPPQLERNGLADLSLPLVFKIGAIDIEIVEVSENEATE